ncbi:DNA-binding SARP family transcriptional activator [Allocatelliglobosispora scoriae]|uniref:DNA-binding SARP family transcriptional activator n=1 Tax=Allocatelliglobosispora scoriae TaxID=643052 RepID=A0A841BK27_9ACTN|nr:BTAD domain-containing putative transcriptional regulator [Allocatelliglobosispora scoriae]MBB5867995.1 DNA-binding SARP family transcriptional activator [Allocatelliglobosispora scoriae]
MAYLVLGPIEVCVGGVPAALGAPKQRAVLAMLLLNAPQPVPVRRLVDELWPDGPPPSAVKNVQVYVYQLRKVLGPPLGSSAAGYRLDPGADLDLARFQRQVDHARQAARSGGRRLAVQLYRRALALWRGPALADLADRDLLRTQAAHLDQRRLRALDECLELELGLGCGEELLAELAQLAADHPLDESLRCHQIRALRAAGRTTEAVAAYRDACRLLARELGVPPGPELRRLADSLGATTGTHCGHCGQSLVSGSGG